MNEATRQTASHPGARISERAVRRALGSRTQTTGAPRVGHDQPTAVQAVAADPTRPRSPVHPLRRWSVAELVARAISRTPNGAVTR